MFILVPIPVNVLINIIREEKLVGGSCTEMLLFDTTLTKSMMESSGDARMIIYLCEKTTLAHRIESNMSQPTAVYLSIAAARV